MVLFISTMFQLLGNLIDKWLLLKPRPSLIYEYSFRKELRNNLTNHTRFEEDRNRTINDYYRMNLDTTAEKEKMKDVYHAYLENTPGSKKALHELLTKKHLIGIKDDKPVEAPKAKSPEPKLKTEAPPSKSAQVLEKSIHISL